MSRTNKHRVNHINSLSVVYMQTELGPRKECIRRSCKGVCIEVWTRYTDHGPINHEYECVLCGKAIKDPRFKQERENWWKRRQEERYNRGGKRARNATNSRSPRR